MFYYGRFFRYPWQAKLYNLIEDYDDLQEHLVLFERTNARRDNNLSENFEKNAHFQICQSYFDREFQGLSNDIITFSNNYFLSVKRGQIACAAFVFQGYINEFYNFSSRNNSK